MRLTKTQLVLLATLLLFLGGNLLGDTVKLWLSSNGGPKRGGITNLPQCAVQNQYTKTLARGVYRFGYRIENRDNGLTIVAPSTMKDCVGVMITAGVPVETRVLANGTMKFSREDLLLLAGQNVFSFFVRIHDIEGNFVLCKVILDESSQEMKLLVQ